MSNTTNAAIPLRQLAGTRTSRSPLWDLADITWEMPRTSGPPYVLVRQAVDGGVTFFDNCWEYHRGKTEDWVGAGLKGVRDRVFLMTKVCTQGRDKRAAMRRACRPTTSTSGRYTR
jgi:aryl-alcohol dehydrogenase-like predicted oxidoreductase